MAIVNSVRLKFGNSKIYAALAIVKSVPVKVDFETILGVLVALCVLPKICKKKVQKSECESIARVIPAFPLNI